MNGRAWTAAELAQEVDGRRALYKTARELRAALKAAAREKRERRSPDAGFVKDVKMTIKASLGRKNAVLASYGIAVEKEPVPLTSEELALRAERNRATRAARHTMGSKQRAAIKGELPGGR
jgi:hypothetical protein